MKQFFVTLVVIWPAILFSQHSKPYFQQETNYTIAVTLDDKKHELNGFEYVEYINRSPSRLDFIYFHLWPNGYKNNETALAKQLWDRGEYGFKYAPDSMRGYIDSLSFRVDDKLVRWEYDSIHPDICKIYLNEPLNPMEKITISTPFKVKIPGDFSRLGHVGQSYQISQWYPKPAVYDREGWHPFPYLDQGEFYSEYGSFDVRITLPENYTVGATGDLQNEDEKLRLQKIADSTAQIRFTKRDYTYESQAFPPSSSKLKKLRYIQKNIHDFAWFADKRYHVLKGSVGLPNSSDSVDTWVMFTSKEAYLWQNSIPYMNDAIYYYSLWNGNYPYKQATAVQGALSAGGGMEYPNVTVIGNAGDSIALDLVITHEVGHNWFYGILGFNERRYPGLDEGINSFNEVRYFETKYPKKSAFFDDLSEPAKKWLNLTGINHKDENYLFYLFQARKNEDQAILIPAEEYTEFNYGAIVYAKMAISMQMLRAHLGDSTFDSGMQLFFRDWKFKHPGPKDLQQSLEKVSGQDLNWFFVEYLNTTKKLDVKVKKLKHANGKIELTLKNKGDYASPVSISAMNKSGILTTYNFKVLEEKRTYSLPSEGATHYQFDGGKNLVEINRRNNYIRSKGILKKARPLEFKLLTSLEKPERNQILWTPIVGWNSSDELMAGLAFHNKSVLEKPFEYILAPMYSFRRSSGVGLADLSYHWYHDRVFKRITANFNYMRFSYNTFYTQGATTSFNRYAPKIRFDIKPQRERSRHRHSFALGAVITEEHTTQEGMADKNNNNAYPHFIYNHEYRSTPVHFDEEFYTEVNDNFSKVSYTGTFKAFYDRGSHAFSARLFVGAFMHNNTNDPRYNWRMDGPTGYHDYTFSTVMPDREQTLDVWQNQMIDQHGAFKSPTVVGQSNEWLTALNLKAEAPFWFPIGLFADMGYSAKGDFEYDGGAFLKVSRDVFEVYFPFIWSENINKAYEVNSTPYGYKIRFILNLHRINPYKLIQPKNL
ncbi:MAG: M1 family metallopeptidase [Flavobacteriales bacterium]|nr:M1 family metallopeptidase [Flavobacteriales bacterium]